MGEASTCCLSVSRPEAHLAGQICVTQIWMVRDALVVTDAMGGANVLRRHRGEAQFPPKGGESRTPSDRPGTVVVLA